MDYDLYGFQVFSSGLQDQLWAVKQFCISQTTLL